MCFSCGKSGHGASWCPEMNETFPYVLPGWSEVGGGYVMISPGSQWNASARETAPDLGWGSAARISNKLRPPVVVMYGSPLPGLRHLHSWWMRVAAGVVVRNM